MLDKAKLEQTAMDMAAKLELQGIVGEKVPDAIVAINEEGIIVYFNHQAELTFGYKEKEVINQPLRILLTDDNIAAHDKVYIPEFFADMRDRPMALRKTLKAKDKWGKIFEVKIYLAGALSDAGKIGIAYIRRVLPDAKDEI
jgi:two-component system, LuxR family, sensor kinase FixL